MKRLKITDANRSSVINGLSEWLTMAKLDEPLEIVIKPWRSTRSTEANRFYWMILGVISSEIGHSKDELHDILRQKFLGGEERIIDGVSYLVLPSTTKLKVQEMSDYIEQICAWAAGMGIRLPAKETANE